MKEVAVGNGIGSIRCRPDFGCREFFQAGELCGGMGLERRTDWEVGEFGDGQPDLLRLRDLLQARRTSGPGNPDRRRFTAPQVVRLTSNIKTRSGFFNRMVGKGTW
jgi:hypothetical protein